MIEWLVQQQGPLCLVLLILVGLEHFLTPRLGARFTYGLWLLVPCTMLLNNLPRQIIAVPSNSFSRYIVGASPPAELTNSQVLLMIWGTGVLALSLFFLLQYGRLSRSIQYTDSDNRQTGYSALATTPMLFGFFAPKILLPENFKALFCSEQQQLILEHEKTHLRQHDSLWNALALLIAMVFWFNPLVWLGMRSFRINQELACDSRVLIAKTNTQKFLYAKALLLCAEHTSQHSSLYPTFGEKSTMFKRLNAIKQPVSASKLCGLAALLLVSAVTANTALATQPQHKVSKAEATHATPVKTVNPVYPKAAAAKNVEGFVVLQFDITEEGATDNIRVVESEPAGVFDKNAKKAFEHWEYKPRIQNGQAQHQTGLLVQLDFKLAEDPQQSAAN